MEEYKTVRERVEVEIEEKKSRFIANVGHVETEEEASEFIEEIRKKYKDSRHNVYAYRVGIENEKAKMSDDGEPAKTAGVPILEIMRNEGIVNSVVVVTRYFGGTLLGTGGLVRAYSRAAKEGLEKSGIVVKRRKERIEIKVAYNMTGKVKNEILKKGEIKDIGYTEEVRYEVLVVNSEAESLVKKVTEITSGSAEIERKGYLYEEDKRNSC